MLPDQVWLRYIEQFLSYSENRILCKPWWIICHFYLSFWICKLWKWKKKITKIKISWEKKNLLDKMKSIFHRFWRAVTWWKNKRCWTQALSLELFIRFQLFHQQHSNQYQNEFSIKMRWSSLDLKNSTYILIKSKKFHAGNKFLGKGWSSPLPFFEN